MRVWADAKFNNLVIYDREICMLQHTHEYYSLGHTLGSFQAHRAAFVSKSAGAYAGEGGALGARAPPTRRKSSPQKCPKEEKKFRPDISAKKSVHVPLRCHKIKTKKVEKKEDISKRKGLKLKK